MKVSIFICWPAQVRSLLADDNVADSSRLPATRWGSTDIENARHDDTTALTILASMHGVQRADSIAGLIVGVRCRSRSVVLSLEGLLVADELRWGNGQMAKRRKTMISRVGDTVTDIKDSVVGALTPPAKAVVRAERAAQKAVVKAGRGAIKSVKRTVASRKKAAKKATVKVATKAKRVTRKAAKKVNKAVKKATKKVAARKKHL